MRYEKQLPVPAPAASVLRIPLSRLRAGDTVRELYLLHVQEGENGLECAEGLVPTSYTCPVKAADLYATCDELFVIYTASAGAITHIYGLVNRRDYNDVDSPNISCIVPAAQQLDNTAPQTWYVVTSRKTWRACVISYSHDLTSALGGSFGAEYAGRFFLFNGRRLYYTKPYTESGWTYKLDGTLNAYGYVEFPPRFGDFAGGACLRDKLYLFFTGGAVEVEMGGKTLNTKTRSIPLDYGAIEPKTVVPIGNKAYFFARCGLCTFDGEKFERLPTPCASHIDFSNAVKVGATRGKFYAFVAVKEGWRRIYVYDPAHGRETYLSVEAEKFAAGFKAFAAKEGAIYELTEHTLPENEACRVCCKLVPAAGKTVRIDWIRIEGKGEFGVEASTPDDGGTLAHGEAGRALPLFRSLYGAELSLTISSRDPDFRITGIAVGMGEAEYDD